MRKCSKCKRLLPETEFYKNHIRSEQRTWCKSCEYENVRLWRRKNPERQKATDRRYKKRHRDEILEYMKSEEKKEINKKYFTSEKGKQKIRINKKKYCQTEKGKKARKRDDRNYRKRHPEKIRELHRKGNHKRRGLKLIELWKNPFPIPFHRHHINNILVIPLPKITHDKIRRSPLEQHRMIAKFWIEKLYCMNLDEIFGE